MAIEFTLLERPEIENAGDEVKSRIRLFGVDIDPSDIDPTRKIIRKRKNPELIDFVGNKHICNRRNNSSVHKRGKGNKSRGYSHDSDDGPWKIQKELFSTDVGVNWGHLQLPKADVEAHILPLMDEEMVKQLESPGKKWLEVRVVDEDKGMVYSGMKLTHYSSTNGFVLNGSWSKVSAGRSLQVKDLVGLYWDPYREELHFSVRDRAPRLAPMNIVANL